MKIRQGPGRLPRAAALVIVLLAAMPPPRDALAIGEQVGRIKGTVTDAASGVGLPGVTITARGPSLIGLPRVVGTDDDGRYELVGLPPGLYTLDISYAGLTPVTRQVVVRQGETAPLNVVWTPEQQEVETIKVVEPRPVAQPDSAQTGTVISADTFSRIPTGRRYQDVARLVPGTSGSANPSIKGGLFMQNRYLVDGLDITDPVTGTYSSNLNFDSIRSVQVLTGAMEAQYNALGGVINTVTAEGSDEVHASAALYVNHQQLSTRNNYGPNLYDDRQPFNKLETGPNQSYQLAANGSGPLLPRRLWLNVTYQLELRNRSAVKAAPFGAAPYEIQHPSENVQQHLLRGKLTWAPSPAHRFTLSANAEHASFNNTQNEDSDEPNTYLGISESHQNQRGWFAIASWDWFVRPDLNTNVQVGFQVNTIEYGPQGRLGDIDQAGCGLFTRQDSCHYDPDRPQHVNGLDGTVWYQGEPYEDDGRWTLQVDPSVSARAHLAGLHDLKAGLQSRFNYRSYRYEAPGGYRYDDNDGSAPGFEGGLCDPAAPDDSGRCFRRTEILPYRVHESGFSVGAYIQDRWWTPWPWLTVVPGLRFDYGHTADRDGVTVSALWGLAPRVAVVADLTQDGRNVVSAAYGRSNEVLSLLAAADLDGREAAVTTEYEYDRATGKFSNKISSSGGAGGLVIDDHLTTPHADEITVSARRQVFPGTLAGIDYTWKRVSNYWDRVEINQIWDPSGSRVVDWVDPGKKHQAVYLYTTPEENHRTYQGIDLHVDGRPGKNWDLAGSYTLSWTYGPGSTVFDQLGGISQFANPRTFRYYGGYLADDVRHAIKAYAAYRIGPLNIGANVQYRTGTPSTKVFWSAQEGSYARYRSPLGTEPGSGNDIRQISELRTPGFVQADLRVSVDLLPGRLVHQLTLIADVFNAFDGSTALAVSTADRTRFGAVVRRQDPFRAQLALRYRY